jgi:large subunit ribosomal protein L24
VTKLKLLPEKTKVRKVLFFLLTLRKTVVVKGVNKIKKHQKPSQTNANGGVVESEGSIHASNVKVISKKEDK